MVNEDRDLGVTILSRFGSVIRYVVPSTESERHAADFGPRSVVNIVGGGEEICFAPVLV